MRKSLQIELKVFGLYTTAAEKVGKTSAEVEEVYSWYMDYLYKSLLKPDTKQIYLKNLGMFRANPACLPNILYYNIVRYRNILEAILKIPKYHTKRKYNQILKTYEQYLTAYEEAVHKMDILLKEELFDKPSYHKQKKRLEEFKTTRLDPIYESICRLHEAVEARDKECRQGDRGHQQQDIKRIQFTK
jgi:hypothetical protein